MKTADYIPRKDEDFDIWQANFFQQLSPVALRLDIPTEKITALQDLQGEWRDNWTASQAPATRTPLAIEKKTRARHAYEAGIRATVRQYLTYNDAVTDDDRVSLGLPIHKTTRTPVPVPTEAPSFDVNTSHIRELHIHYHPPGSKTDGAKPFGVHGAELRWAIRDTPPADDIETDLLHSNFDTHSPIVLKFKEGERGKTVYFALRWENTRGDKGPWGDIGSSIIP